MNNLLTFMANTLSSATAKDVTNDSQAYSTMSTLDNNVYYLSSLLHQNPQTPDIGLHTYTRGIIHTADATKKIVYRPTSDRFATLGSEATLYDPTDGTFFVQDPSIGYDSNGRLHIMADCHESFSPGDAHELRYMYSDDNGLTVSSPVVIPFPATSLLTFRCYGRIIDCGDGVLMCFPYFFTDEGSFTNSERWCLRTEDFGANWSWVLIAASTEYINETEGLHIIDGVVVAVSRYESLSQFWMYKSEDLGLTWISCGPLGTGISLTVAAPCRLHKFSLDDGTECVAMYFHDKGATPKRVYGMYGRLDVGVVAGIGLFKQTTATQIASDASFMLNYGDLCHYNGNLNARGVYTREVNFPTDNELLYFEAPATHYGTLFSVLTPVTVYDVLANPMTIYNWRGLIINNTNDYGSVSISNEVTQLKSIFPGPTGKNFTATVGGITLGDGIVFDGTKALAHNTADWNFLNFSAAGAADINWTMHACVKFGTTANPDAVYGFFGTNGSSAGNIGVSIFFDDRSSLTRNNGLALNITRGGGNFVINFFNNNIITPNVFFVLTIEIDLSESVNDNKVRVYVNGTLQTTTVTTFGATLASNPTFNAQIGATGNNVLPGILTLKHLLVQNAIDIPSVRNYIIDTLMDLEGI